MAQLPRDEEIVGSNLATKCHLIYCVQSLQTQKMKPEQRISQLSIGWVQKGMATGYGCANCHQKYKEIFY